MEANVIRGQKTLRDTKRTPETDDRFWDDYAEMQEAEQEMAREFANMGDDDERSQ
jgi:hypothetical protein